MSFFSKPKSGLALAFLSVALVTGCGQAGSEATTASTASVAAKPAPCTIDDKTDAGTYNLHRVIDFDTDVVVHKMGFGESGITATPFSELSPRAQQKLETLRKTLPAHCQ